MMLEHNCKWVGTRYLKERIGVIWYSWGWALKCLDSNSLWANYYVVDGWGNKETRYKPQRLFEFNFMLNSM